MVSRIRTRPRVGASPAYPVPDTLVPVVADVGTTPDHTWGRPVDVRQRLVVLATVAPPRPPLVADEAILGKATIPTALGRAILVRPSRLVAGPHATVVAPLRARQGRLADAGIGLAKETPARRVAASRPTGPVPGREVLAVVEEVVPVPTGNGPRLAPDVVVRPRPTVATPVADSQAVRPVLLPPIGSAVLGVAPNALLAPMNAGEVVPRPATVHVTGRTPYSLLLVEYR